MALLKSLIQRLLDSRTTPAQAVHADRINFNSGTIFNTDTFIAPRDGFVRVWAEIAAGGEGTRISLETNSQIISAMTFLGASANNLIIETWPVKKGDSVSIATFNLNVVSRYFFDAIGGGYNSIIWRTLSCLRALSNYLPKIFSRTKSLGLEINPSHHLQKLPSLLRTGLNTRLLRMAGSESVTLQLHGPRFTPQLRLSPQAQMVQPYVMCPSERVKLSFATSVQTLRKQKASLFPQSVQTNLQTGGALC